MTTYRKSTKWTIEQLNEQFTPLSFEARIRKLYALFSEKEVLFTSSFGTSSAFLLSLISRIQPEQQVYFLDTTYHFRETLAYKAELTDLFQLNVIDVRPDVQGNAKTRDGAWWQSRPDDCCYVNKIAPLEPIKARHKVWISGVMGFQTPHRANLRIFEWQDGLLKFHPLVDIDEGEFLYYQSLHQLPPHPLEALGYGSVGCEHCTEAGAGRSGRWSGKEKTECGLHPGYFAKISSGK